MVGAIVKFVCVFFKGRWKVGWAGVGALSLSNHPKAMSNFAQLCSNSFLASRRLGESEEVVVLLNE